MKNKVIKRWVYIPGLDQFNKAVVKALSLFYHKFIKDSLPVLPLPVRLIEAKASVAGKICIVLIFMKALFLETIEQAKGQ